MKAATLAWSGADSHSARPGRSLATLIVLGLIGALGFTGLCALGTWQLERRVWKHALIERIEQRVRAAPVAAAGPAAWPLMTAASDEYRHATASGHFLGDRETLVQASTDLGAGFWVMTPFRTAEGFTVLVNRGFMPPDRRKAPRIAGDTTVTGLVRMTEPRGGFLRANDPLAERWYSRDVAAIAAAHGLGTVAPYFIDADAGPDADALPVGGLTKLDFPDNHLVYALTWFALAIMLAAGIALVARQEYRVRHAPSPQDI